MYAYSLHELLAHHPPANPLLPQLRTLVFHDGYPCFTLVRFFLTPTLERLKIKSHAIYEPDVVSLMNEVVANHKNLRYLSLDLWRDDGSVLRGGFVFSKRLAAPTDAEASALMSLFRALPDLQVYHGLLNMSAARTEALAALPRLATVHIDIKRAEIKTVAAAARLRVRDPYAGLWFASLTSLSLSLDRLDVDTETFLGAIQSPSLQKLMIDFEEQPDTGMVQKHCAAIARAPYRDSFTTLELVCECYKDKDERRDRLIVGEALRPLYALHGIRTVIVRRFVLFAGSDTLRDIAQAWPQLEILSLACVNMWEERRPDDPRIVLADLVPFVLACPRLRGLDIELHADEVSDAEVLAQLLPAPSQSPLEYLAVNYGPIVDAQRVADFLLHVFPALRLLWHTGVNGVRPYCEEPYTYQREWEEVRDLVEPLHREGSESWTPTDRRNMPLGPFVVDEPLLSRVMWKW